MIPVAVGVAAAEEASVLAEAAFLLYRTLRTILYIKGTFDLAEMYLDKAQSLVDSVNTMMGTQRDTGSAGVSNMEMGDPYNASPDIETSMAIVEIAERFLSRIIAMDQREDTKWMADNARAQELKRSALWMIRLLENIPAEEFMTISRVVQAYFKNTAHSRQRHEMVVAAERVALQHSALGIIPRASKSFNMLSSSAQTHLNVITEAASPNHKLATKMYTHMTYASLSALASVATPKYSASLANADGQLAIQLVRFAVGYAMNLALPFQHQRSDPQEYIKATYDAVNIIGPTMGVNVGIPDQAPSFMDGMARDNAISLITRMNAHAASNVRTVAIKLDQGKRIVDPLTLQVSVMEL